MSELLTAAQMKAIEAAAIASGAVTGLELMERAGAGVVAAVLAEWPELALTVQRAVVLCGPGNNGGDGFVVARLLAARGWAVEVFLYGDAAKLPPDARVNYERWVEVGEVRAWDDSSIEDCLDEQDHDLVVDALFGIGFSRPMPDDMERVWHGFVPTVTHNLPTERRQKYVAIDMPSGICSDSGRNLEGALPTDLTVTFHSAKLGHYLDPVGPPRGGATWCGKICVVDIGLVGAMSVGGVRLVLAPRGSVQKMRTAHKFSHGHALILSGDHGHAGAARLAARGALRIGAGLVTVASPPGAMAENAARLDAVMLRLVADAAGLAEVLADARITALCIGPGLGVARAAEMVLVAVRAKHAPYVVFDADALTALSQDQGLFAVLNDRCVLTPHAGEFARLFPDIAEKLAAPAMRGPAYSKVDATRDAAKRAGCVVLYKGADTVIADPSGRCAINAAVYERSAPWLATAGSGDVLAGFIAGLLARGFAPFEAACTAAWLHVECARSFGPGLIAEDLPEELPKVFRALGV